MLTRTLIGAVLGGALGYGWYRLTGCSSGACPLTRKPWITITYGVVVGIFVAGGFR
jgi:hypothetical protein